MVVYDDLEPSEKVKVYDRGVDLVRDPEGLHELIAGYRIGDMASPRLSQKEALRAEAEHFIECVREGLRPITDGHSGMRVIRLLEAASLSMKEKGRAIEIKKRS